MVDGVVVDGVVVADVAAAGAAVEMVAAVVVAEAAGERVCTIFFNGRHFIIYILEVYCMKLWKKDISHIICTLSFRYRS